MATVLGFAAAIPPARWVDSFFLAAAGGILALQLFPRDLRQQMSEYGARRSPSAAEAGSVDRRRSGPGPRPPERTVQNCLAALAGAPVPHACFWHYYLLSVSWSALWAWQFLCSGSLMAAMARAQVVAQADSVDLACVVLAWAMLLAQGLRRLYESLCVSRPGRTPMLAIHWLLGLAYYSVMNTAVWIHGAGALLGSPPPSVLAAGRTLRLSSALALFFAASLTQNECHRYLASLEKYTLPTEGLFRYLVCPHYACECAIYLALAVVAAPAGSVVNSSVLCGLVFVTVNLGVTAHGTKKWYGRKFGQDKVAGRWSMIPLVI